MTLTTEYPGEQVDSHKIPHLQTSMPSITWSLRTHKTGIVISWSILFTSSLILPLVLFYTFKYNTDLDMTVILAVATALFGAPTLYSLATRSWNLLKRNSKCRPLGSKGPWELDFFHYNFLCGFIVVTAVIVVGNVLVNPRVSALGLPVLITEVGVQMLVAAILAARKVPFPIVVSSVRRGKPIRGGCYAITEDIIAVDSDGGSLFRQELSDRWEASPEIRHLLSMMDWAWGSCAVAVGSLTIGLVFGLKDEDAAWAVGWVLPWSLAVVGGLLTFAMCRRILKQEKSRVTQLGNV